MNINDIVESKLTGRRCLVLSDEGDYWLLIECKNKGMVEIPKGSLAETVMETVR